MNNKKNRRILQPKGKDTSRNHSYHPILSSPKQQSLQKINKIDAHQNQGIHLSKISFQGKTNLYDSVQDSNIQSDKKFKYQITQNQYQKREKNGKYLQKKLNKEYKFNTPRNLIPIEKYNFIKNPKTLTLTPRQKLNQEMESDNFIPFRKWHQQRISKALQIKKQVDSSLTNCRQESTQEGQTELKKLFFSKENAKDNNIVKKSDKNYVGIYNLTQKQIQMRKQIQKRFKKSALRNYKFTIQSTIQSAVQSKNNKQQVFYENVQNQVSKEILQNQGTIAQAIIKQQQNENNNILQKKPDEIQLYEDNNPIKKTQYPYQDEEIKSNKSQNIDEYKNLKHLKIVNLKQHHKTKKSNNRRFHSNSQLAKFDRKGLRIKTQLENRSHEKGNSRSIDNISRLSFLKPFIPTINQGSINSGRSESSKNWKLVSIILLNQNRKQKIKEHRTQTQPRRPYMSKSPINNSYINSQLKTPRINNSKCYDIPKLKLKGMKNLQIKYNF